MNDDSLSSVLKLPIQARKNDIISAVNNNQITIITAETGAGKSTQVPQFLAEQGYKKIIVTQPRILAARNLSDRVRQEYSYHLGRDATNLVGYRTAHERDDSPETVILYCTDGLQLVRELTGSGIRDRQILILDEVHEWNENMEVLVAWAKKRCREDANFKVVLMSATIESASLAAYYGAATPISIDGRSYPVAKRHGGDLVGEIIQQLETGTSNMLVFLPGKAEIESVAEAISSAAGHDVPIIPLHSQLEPAAQQLAFASYPHGKVILSTNIAQTSVTIEDIDVVIDSGLERRAEVRSGVEGLFIEETSQADCAQRAGRAGRTKAGLYILAKLGSLPSAPIEERAAYGVPEILRKHIDRLVLRLANIGIDIEDLDFYHAPSRKSMKFAKHTLVSLGALTTTKQVTPIGKEMERFPVESSYARMLVESKRFDTVLQAKLVAIIAIQEVGGIVKGGPRYTGWRKFSRQTQSDLIAQYEVYLALDQIDAADFDDFGIIAKNIDKSEEIIGRLNHDLGLAAVELTGVTDDEMPMLLQCITAGQLHQLWTVGDDRQATHLSTGKQRELSSTTVVKQAMLVAGTPFDLQIPTPKGLETLHLVNSLTSVDPVCLTELAPESFRMSPGKIFYDARYGGLATQARLEFNGQGFDVASAPITERTTENKRLFVTLFAAYVYDQLEKERLHLQSLNSRRLPEIPLRQLQQQVSYQAENAVSMFDLSKKQKTELMKLAKLEFHLGARYMSGLVTSDQKSARSGPGRRKWKFNPKKHFSRNRERDQGR